MGFPSKTRPAPAKHPEIPPPERIVAEVTRNWGVKGDESKTTLSERFEDVIEVNKWRGYKLESWQFCQVVVPVYPNAFPTMTETIVAVFVRTL